MTSPTSPADGESLEQRILKWLDGEGYRLEYLTHGAFHDAGVRATLGPHFDSAEGKRREVDVTAFMRRQSPSVSVARVLCECKYSKERPWLLLHADMAPNILPDWMATPKSRILRDKVDAIPKYREYLQECWQFSPQRRLAHALVQAFRKDNRDDAFNALAKISHAAWDYVDTPEVRGDGNHELVALPCLIVDAPIYLAHFDHVAGSFVLKRVPSGRVSWSGCRDGTMVDVVHIDEVRSYAKATKVTLEHLLEVLEHMRQAVASSDGS